MPKLVSALNGEQSGHIILGKFATTGDGILVALEILFSLRKGKKASKLFNVFKSIPQILENIAVKDKNIVSLPRTKLAIKKAEKLKNMVFYTFHAKQNFGRNSISEYVFLPFFF